jgi:hypothetical protein
MPTAPAAMANANYLYLLDLWIYRVASPRDWTPTFVQRRYEPRKFYMVQIYADGNNSRGGDGYTRIHTNQIHAVGLSV